jgi:hypothetical protein
VSHTEILLASQPCAHTDAPANINQQAWQRAVNIRALVVLGVAAVVSTGLVQPSAFGHRSG